MGAPTMKSAAARAGAGNIISGNAGDGIDIEDATATGNTIEGNLIGTDSSGLAAVHNDSGILINGASFNVVGGPQVSERNVISGNNSQGIEIDGSGATGNTVEGNLIGTDITGAKALGNANDGVYINAGQLNVIGGNAAAARNVISSNTLDGIFIGDGVQGTTVEGDFIGVDVTGLVALGNEQNGVNIYGGSLNVIGGTTAGAHNIISGNESNGVEIQTDDATGNIVEGNYIGTNVGGTTAVANLDAGVEIVDAPGNIIGGSVAGQRNVISGNQLPGTGDCECERQFERSGGKYHRPDGGW